MGFGERSGQLATPPHTARFGSRRNGPEPLRWQFRDQIFPREDAAEEQELGACGTTTYQTCREGSSAHRHVRAGTTAARVPQGARVLTPGEGGGGVPAWRAAAAGDRRGE